MIRVFLLSRAAFPANSRISAARYSRTAARYTGAPEDLCQSANNMIQGTLRTHQHQHVEHSCLSSIDGGHDRPEMQDRLWMSGCTMMFVNFKPTSCERTIARQRSKRAKLAPKEDASGDQNKT